MNRRNDEELLHPALPLSCRRFRAAASQELDDPAAGSDPIESASVTGHELHCQSCHEFAMTIRRLHHEARRWAGMPAPAPPDEFTTSIMRAVQASQPRVRVSGALVALLFWTCALAGGLLLARHLAVAELDTPPSWLSTISTATDGIVVQLAHQVKTYFGLPLNLADRGLAQVSRVSSSSSWWLAIALASAAAFALIVRRGQPVDRRHTRQ